MTHEEDMKNTKGLTNATAKAFEEFLKQLTPTGKCFAELLAKLHCGELDSEFLAMADAEARSGAFTFAFPDLFKGTASDEHVGGLFLTILHTACLKWMESAIA